MQSEIAAQRPFLRVWAGQRNPPDRIRRNGRIAPQNMGSDAFRKRHLTLLYKGDPAGIRMLSELLRAVGLAAKRQPSDNPLVTPMVWEAQHEAIESYGTDLDVSGGEHIHTKAAAAVSKFNQQYGGPAQASVVN